MRYNRPVLEKTVEKQINRYAKAVGVLTYKFSSPARRGVPDRVFVAPGGAVGFLEVKRAKKRPTPLQQHELDKLSLQGALADYADSLERGKNFIDGLLLL